MNIILNKFVGVNWVWFCLVVIKKNGVIIILAFVYVDVITMLREFKVFVVCYDRQFAVFMKS